MRRFVDNSGQQWTVWEVRPGRVLTGAAGERRQGSERRGEAAPDPIIERRRVGERRTRVRARIAGVAAPFVDGWLTFQTGAQRRRLAPVPADWEAMPPSTLDELCRRANPA